VQAWKVIGRQLEEIFPLVACDISVLHPLVACDISKDMKPSGRDPPVEAWKVIGRHLEGVHPLVRLFGGRSPRDNVRKCLDSGKTSVTSVSECFHVYTCPVFLSDSWHSKYHCRNSTNGSHKDININSHGTNFIDSLYHIGY
jgi:hypothetical protein